MSDGSSKFTSPRQPAVGNPNIRRVLIGVIAITLLGALYAILRPARPHVRPAKPHVPDMRGELWESTHDPTASHHSFCVFLVRDGEPEVLFESPEEPGPPGTERFLWSPDKRWMLLVGRQYQLTQDIRTPEGDSCYLLYDVQTHTLLCNTSQSDWPTRFSVKDLQDAGFTFPATTTR